jgi:hypothetical protein
MGLGPALRRRRRLRAGLVQLVYLLVAIALGLLVPRISAGATVDSRRATEMLVAVGAAFVPFIAMADSWWQVSRRVERLLAGLIAIATADRAEAVQARIERTRPR